MIALLKAYWIYLAVGVAAFVVYRKTRVVAAAPYTGGPRATSVPATPEQVAAATVAATDWPGGANLKPTDFFPADQTQYEGFLTTKQGGYYNPTTGEAYSPGSSPPVYTSFQTRVDQGLIAPAPTIDISGAHYEGPPIDKGTDIDSYFVY